MPQAFEAAAGFNENAIGDGFHRFASLWEGAQAIAAEALGCTKKSLQAGGVAIERLLDARSFDSVA